jgi:hypothetical protein
MNESMEEKTNPMFRISAAEPGTMEGVNTIDGCGLM